MSEAHLADEQQKELPSDELSAVMVMIVFKEDVRKA